MLFSQVVKTGPNYFAISMGKIRRIRSSRAAQRIGSLVDAGCLVVCVSLQELQTTYKVTTNLWCPQPVEQDDIKKLYKLCLFISQNVGFWPAMSINVVRNGKIVDVKTATTPLAVATLGKQP